MPSLLAREQPDASFGYAGGFRDHVKIFDCEISAYLFEPPFSDLFPDAVRNLTFMTVPIMPLGLINYFAKFTHR